MMTRSRERLLAVVTVVGTIVTVLAVAEVALRYLPVSTGFLTVPTTSDNPVFHFTPNRDFVYSRDWDLALVNRGHINNAGFINDQDYHKQDATPLLAIVGDSYIEAAMVPYRQTIQGRLAAKLKDSVRVYSFGASGAPLSQYLVWARHAVQEYGAQALIINVVGNDFDESLAEYKTGPGFWHYLPDDKGVLRLRLFEYRPGRLRGLVVTSALARYLFMNLHLGGYWEDLKAFMSRGAAKTETRYAGNTAADAEPRRVQESLVAIDAFFRDLPDFTGMRPTHIAFTMDGFRYPEEAARGAGSYFDLMRRAFQAKARALGYEVIDLDPRFFVRHREHGERFEFAQDGHWNALGHQMAEEAVIGSNLLAAFAQTYRREVRQ
jgi:hypothetical protein